MVKVKGTFGDAVGMLTVGQYEAARRDLENALKIDHISRTSWNMYLKGIRQMRINQVIDCQRVFAQYGIEWTYDAKDEAVKAMMTLRRPACNRVPAEVDASEI